MYTSYAGTHVIHADNIIKYGLRTNFYTSIVIAVAIGTDCQSYFKYVNVLFFFFICFMTVIDNLQSSTFAIEDLVLALMLELNEPPPLSADEASFLRCICCVFAV